ncbi:hypothetical protein GCM10010472_21320 [Pseudonocardia halophobica]|uniref:DUF3040 domain-containing protein n=1 Tax=Pseudonocardia halophobica TaxID=29401 RepID=A0A9W6KZC3_9PSEU|nr:DUF3040 domain-containing protein [Pseudonocardia halophobica]GLL09364.1 hypothetical protein GCM10017577_05040 [Pseudonocardia halophobica]
MPSAFPPPPSPPPGRDPGPPLTDHEKHLLADLGCDLQANDPGLADELSGGPREWPAWLTFDRVVQVLAVLAVIVVLLPADWAALLLILALMIGLPLILLLVAERRARGPDG